MQFQCFHRWEDEDERETWAGEITEVESYGGHYEFRIRSRSNIRVLVGKFSFGLFACIPDFKAGCFLGSLSDIFYNKERLIQAMGNIVDAVTVAYALNTLSGHISLE